MRGLPFLLSALFLLESTKGTEYETLSDHEKNIVDKAIEKGNREYGKGKHLDFYTIVKRENVLNVILRPTSCTTTTPSAHQKKCKTQNKPPQVSCIDCKGIMEKCFLLKQMEKITETMNKCANPSFLAGGAHSLFQKGENQQPLTGCLGCI